VELHRRIRTLRLRRSITGIELARRAGVSPSYVSLIEHGEKIPSEDVAVRIARVLGEEEDLYRVWAATSRMDEKTRAAVLRIRNAEPAAVTAEQTVGGEQRDRTCAAVATAEEFFIAPPLLEARRPPGRPRKGARGEIAVSHDLGVSEAAGAFRLPLLVPGSLPTSYPPLEEDIESLITIDGRLLGCETSEGLVAIRVDESSGRNVRSWLAPRDIVVIDRNPGSFDAGRIHAFKLPDGLCLTKASLISSTLLLLPDPAAGEQPTVLPLENRGQLDEILYGAVIWSARYW